MTSDLGKLGPGIRALSDYELIIKINQQGSGESVNTTNWRIQAPKNGSLKL